MELCLQCTNGVCVSVPPDTRSRFSLLSNIESETPIRVEWASDAVSLALGTAGNLNQADNDLLVAAICAADFLGRDNADDELCEELAELVRRTEDASTAELKAICDRLPPRECDLFMRSLGRDTCARLNQANPGIVTGSLRAFPDGGFCPCVACTEWIHSAIETSVAESAQRCRKALPRNTPSLVDAMEQYEGALARVRALEEHYENMSGDDSEDGDELGFAVEEAEGVCESALEKLGGVSDFREFDFDNDDAIAREAWVVDWGSSLSSEIDMDEGYITLAIAIVTCGALFSKNWSAIADLVHGHGSGASRCLLCACRPLVGDQGIVRDYINTFCDTLCTEYAVRKAETDLQDDAYSNLSTNWISDARDHAYIFRTLGYCNHCGQAYGFSIDGRDEFCFEYKECQWAVGDNEAKRRHKQAVKDQTAAENARIQALCNQPLPKFMTTKKSGEWRCHNCNDKKERCGSCNKCCRNPGCGRHYPRFARQTRFVLCNRFVTFDEDLWLRLALNA